MPSSSASSFSRKFRFDGFPMTTSDHEPSKTPTAQTLSSRHFRDVEELRQRVGDRDREVRKLERQLAKVTDDLDRCKTSKKQLQDTHEDARDLLREAFTHMQELHEQVGYIISPEFDQGPALPAVRKVLEDRWLPYLDVMAEEIKKFLQEGSRSASQIDEAEPTPTGGDIESD